MHAATGIDYHRNNIDNSRFTESRDRETDSKLSMSHAQDSKFFVTVEVKKTIDTSY